MITPDKVIIISFIITIIIGTVLAGLGYQRAANMSLRQIYMFRKYLPFLPRTSVELENPYISRYYRLDECSFNQNTKFYEAKTDTNNYILIIGEKTTINTVRTCDKNAHVITCYVHTNDEYEVARNNEIIYDLTELKAILDKIPSSATLYIDDNGYFNLISPLSKSDIAELLLQYKFKIKFI